MTHPGRAPVAWWRLIVGAAGAAALATVGVAFVLVKTTPPCGGPWCLYALVWLPVTGVAAAIVALGVAFLARRGFLGYVAGLAAGAAGYAGAWYVIANGTLFSI